MNTNIMNWLNGRLIDRMKRRWKMEAMEEQLDGIGDLVDRKGPRRIVLVPLLDTEFDHWCWHQRYGQHSCLAPYCLYTPPRKGYQHAMECAFRKHWNRIPEQFLLLRPFINDGQVCKGYFKNVWSKWPGAQARTEVVYSREMVSAWLCTYKLSHHM